MKKLLILLIPIVLIGLTACGKTHNEMGDKAKTIVLEDTKLGLKTTFTYEEKDKYGDIEFSDEGASRSVEFDNEELDAEFEMYYNTMTDTAYKTSQDTRKNQKYYKEYKFNKYKAYAYSEYPNNIKLNILLKENDNKMYDVLFVSIDRLDTDDSIVMADLLKEEDLQKFFKSMKFEKIKVKKEK